MIDSKLIAEMKELVKKGKEKGKVLDASEAFKKYPPEGKWRKDKEGHIVVEELYKKSLG